MLLIPHITLICKLSICIFAGKQARLSITIVKHIIEVMQSEIALKYVGVQHTDMLLKDVLSMRKYVCDVELTKWQG